MKEVHPLQEKIKSNFDLLSPNDKEIANFVLKNSTRSALETVDFLAKEASVSKSAVVRFARKIGYKSFKSLQKELKEHVYNQKMESPLDLLSKARKIGDYRKDIFMKQFIKNIENLRVTSESIQTREFDKVIKRLCSGEGSIFIMGQRKSYALAVYLNALFVPMLDRVYLLEAGESFLTDNLLSIKSKDLLIVFSFKRYTMIPVKVAEYFKSVGATVVLITDSYIADISKWADYTFICASEGVIIWESAVSAISLIEAIVSAVATYKGKVVRNRLKTSEYLLGKFQILKR